MHQRRMWMLVGVTRPLLRMFPDRADVNRVGSIDAEVMVVVDRLVLVICERSTAGAVSNG